MSKIWKVPIHHEKISSLNINQVMIYSSLIAEDKRLEFEKTRDFIEYLAAFSESKAVAEVRNRRLDASGHKSTAKEFEKQISTRDFIPKDILDTLNKNTNLSSNNVKIKNRKSISGKMISKAIED